MAAPSNVIVAGTSTIRIKVASTRTATANPRPIIFTVGSSTSRKLAKTLTMMIAADVMTRAVWARPSTTLWWLSPVATQFSRMRESRNTS